MEHVNEQWQEALVKYLVNESSPSEAKEVEQWLEADAANRAYFEQLRTIWDQSRQLAPQLSIHENDAWERFRHRIGEEANAAGSKGSKELSINEEVPYWKDADAAGFGKVAQGKHSPDESGNLAGIPVRRLSWMRVAAVFILLAGCGWLGWRLLQDGKPLLVEAGDQVLHYTLPDGSSVILNKQAVISYAKGFSGNSRKVVLKGEAFFEVATDVQKPFMVQAGDVEIKVLGTSFNVRSDEAVTEVVVETGRVAVSRHDHSIELKEKEKAVIRAGADTPQKEAVDNSLYNYYRSDRFVCEATPLRDLVAVLNEAYHANIIIGDKRLEDLQLTTTFSTESLDKILEVIKQTFDIRVEKENSIIILK